MNLHYDSIHAILDSLKEIFIRELQKWYSNCPLIIPAMKSSIAKTMYILL